MKARVVILLILCWQMALSANACLHVNMQKHLDCIINKSISAFDLPSYRNTPNSFEVLNTNNFTGTKLNLLEEFPKTTDFELLSEGFTKSDFKINVVYENMISLTYDTGKHLGVIDHFIFEFITDKYRNKFALFTLKIDLL